MGQLIERMIENSRKMSYSTTHSQLIDSPNNIQAKMEPELTVTLIPMEHKDSFGYL